MSHLPLTRNNTTMKGDFLSGKEKVRLFKESRQYVQRERSKTAFLLHTLNVAHGAIRILGRGHGYSVGDLICKAEEREIWEEYRVRKRDLQSMQSRGLIEVEEVDDAVLVSISNRGFVKSLLMRAASSTARLPDGNVCMVSYDIPEHAKRARDNFRRALSNIGFRMLQRSVWICDMDIVDVLHEYVEELGLSKYVAICLATVDTDISRSRRTWKIQG